MPHRIFLFLVFFANVLHANLPQEYFIELKLKLSKAFNQKNIINKIREEEFQKFKNSGNEDYLLAYKYATLYFYDLKKDGVQFFITSNEVLKLNNARYPIITTEANNSIANYLEGFSPEISLKYINEAISNELRYNEKSDLIPHLYHFKGKLYFNLKNYDQALHFFQLALNHYKSTDYLYISSMHNNFGLVFAEQKNYKKSIAEFEKALSYLSKLNMDTDEELDFKYLIFSNLGEVYHDLSDNKNALYNWEKVLHYLILNPRKVNERPSLIFNLYNCYSNQSLLQKRDDLILFLKKVNGSKIELNDEFNKVYASILLDYSFKKANIKDAEFYSQRLNELNEKNANWKKEQFAKISNLLNKNIIENVNQKFDYQVERQNRKIFWMSLTFFLIVVIFVTTYILLYNKRKKDKQLYISKNLISDQQKRLMEQDLLIKNEKIKNLHLNLNLKQETEKVFLDKIKKVRKSDAENVEQVLRELYFDMNNLIGIDKKSIGFSEESSTENKQFITLLSEKYPFLNEQELQFCVYFRLDLSAKEISVLEKITDGSVRVYKSKIKSKLGLKKDESLVEFLKSI